MKKTKIMLIAIAVVATVGGALAFKAQRIIHKNVFCAKLNPQQQIVCSTTDFKTTNCQINPFVTTPCQTWHNAISLGATRISSCYTTNFVNGQNGCPEPIRCCATITNVQ